LENEILWARTGYFNRYPAVPFLKGLMMLREIESRLEAACSDELRRTVYELVLIFAMLALLLLMLKQA
jgi:hypothetical protein